MMVAVYVLVLIVGVLGLAVLGAMRRSAEYDAETEAAFRDRELLP